MAPAEPGWARTRTRPHVSGEPCPVALACPNSSGRDGDSIHNSHQPLEKTVIRLESKTIMRLPFARRWALRESVRPTLVGAALRSKRCLAIDEYQKTVGTKPIGTATAPTDYKRSIGVIEVRSPFRPIEKTRVPAKRLQDRNASANRSPRKRAACTGDEIARSISWTTSLFDSISMTPDVRSGEIDAPYAVFSARELVARLIHC